VIIIIINKQINKKITKGKKRLNIYSKRKKKFQRFRQMKKQKQEKEKVQCLSKNNIDKKEEGKGLYFY
jgi:hypothetical protein